VAVDFAAMRIFEQCVAIYMVLLLPQTQGVDCCRVPRSKPAFHALGRGIYRPQHASKKTSFSELSLSKAHGTTSVQPQARGQDPGRSIRILWRRVGGATVVQASVAGVIGSAGGGVRSSWVGIGSRAARWEGT